MFLRRQWRNNRACKACSARGPSAVGGTKFARRCFLKVFFGEEGALLEYLHAGPLQPSYATVRRYTVTMANSEKSYKVLIVAEQFFLQIF